MAARRAASRDVADAGRFRPAHPAPRFAHIVAPAAVALLAAHAAHRRRTDAHATALLVSVPDALFLLDPQGRVRQANAGFARLVPHARIGQRLHPRLGHVRPDGSRCPGGCTLDGAAGAATHVVAVEGERITRRGVIVPVSYTTQRLGARGFVAVAMHDVSARVAEQAQRQIRVGAVTRRDEQVRLLRALTSVAQPPADLPGGLVVDVAQTGAVVGRCELPVEVGALPDGRVLALGIDAAGDDALSPRDAWEIRYVSRAHLVAGGALGEMVSQCADVLTGVAGAPHATLVGVVVEPDTGVMQVAGGGHLPPLLVAEDGSTTWLKAPGRAIGDPHAGSRAVRTAELRPGDVLMLYSDAVVRGSGGPFEGLARLRATAIALRDQPPEGWSRRVLGEVQPAADRPAALLALRLAGVGAASGSRLPSVTAGGGLSPHPCGAAGRHTRTTR